jgi:hypothetical protein
VRSGSRKWKLFDQFPIWFVDEIARTRQCHVSPVSRAVAGVYVVFVKSNPASFHEVEI